MVVLSFDEAIPFHSLIHIALMGSRSEMEHAASYVASMTYLKSIRDRSMLEFIDNYMYEARLPVDPNLSIPRLEGGPCPDPVFAILVNLRPEMNVRVEPFAHSVAEATTKLTRPNPLSPRWNVHVSAALSALDCPTSHFPHNHKYSKTWQMDS